MSYEGWAGAEYHEGWAAHYFPDGQVSCGWADNGPMSYWQIPGLDNLPAQQGGTQRRWTYADSVGAVFVCTCGWRSAARPGADPEDEAIESELHRAWLHHLVFHRPRVVAPVQTPPLKLLP